MLRQLSNRHKRGLPPSPISSPEVATALKAPRDRVDSSQTSFSRVIRQPGNDRQKRETDHNRLVYRQARYEDMTGQQVLTSIES